MGSAQGEVLDQVGDRQERPVARFGPPARSAMGRLPRPGGAARESRSASSGPCVCSLARPGPALGPLLRQRVEGVAAAVGEGLQPGQNLGQGRDQVPLISLSRRRDLVRPGPEPGHGAEQTPRCRGGSGRANRVSVARASSTTLAGVHEDHHPGSQVWATTPRSWVMRRTADADLVLEAGHEEREDLGLDGHVQGGGRLVGDEEPGAGRPGAMAIMTRWRMPPGELGGGSRPAVAGPPGSGPCSSQARGLVVGPRCLSRPRWTISGSATWRPMDRTGLREVIGSWKIMEICRPRTRRICSRRFSVEEVLAPRRKCARN